MRQEDRVHREYGVVCIEITNTPQTFNATLLDTNGCVVVDDSKLDTTTQQLLRDNKEKLEEFASCVGRVHTRALCCLGSGVIFAVAPQINE